MATKPKKTAKKTSSKPSKKSAEKVPELKVEVRSIKKTPPADLPQEKIIYIEVDEEVTSVIDRLKRIPNKVVLLVVPKRAMLLQSVINLKLLKTQIKKLNKELAVVTSDKKGQTIASQVGLTVYHDLKSRGIELPAEAEEKIVVPMKAQITKEEQKPVMKAGKKSLKDLLRGKSDGFFKRVGPQDGNKLYKAPASPSGKDKINSSSFVLSGPSRKLLGFFLGASVLALLTIMVFILPNAVIYVKPEIKIEKPLIRLTLADQASYEAELKVKTDTVIASNPVDTNVEMTKTYAATGKSASGMNAQGMITMHNDSGANQLLIKTTRLRSSNGSIYRIQSDVTVPAKQTIKVFAVADTLNEAGEVAGTNANLETGARLSVPALTGENKDKVYGIAEEAIANGTTEPVSVVTQADIDAAKKDIVDQLNNSVKAKLIERINSDNAARGTNLALLASDSALKTKIVEVKVMDGVQANQVLKEFKVYAKAYVAGVTFDKNEVVEMLNRELNKALPPNMYLSNADLESLALQYVSEEAAGKRIKVNASMAYKLEYTLDDDLKAKIIEHVLGKGIKETGDYVQGLDEISEAQVSTWPFWVRKIPGIASNVKVEKMEQA